MSGLEQQIIEPMSSLWTHSDRVDSFKNAVGLPSSADRNPPNCDVHGEHGFCGGIALAEAVVGPIDPKDMPTVTILHVV